MPDRIKFHLGDKSMEMGSSEISQFKDSLVRAEYDYTKAVGRQPTHLVLGQLEYCKLCALVELMKLNGEIGYYTTSYSRVTEWRGMILLQSHKDELILASEIIEPAG